jgi:hypothetical protein
VLLNEKTTMYKERKFTSGKSNLLFIPLQINVMQRFRLATNNNRWQGKSFCLFSRIRVQYQSLPIFCQTQEMAAFLIHHSGLM